MNLYVIQYPNYSSTIRYIIGEDKEQALNKWLQVVSSAYHDKVEVKLLCKRDAIIPCVDPKIEFDKMKIDFYDLNSKKQS